MKHKDKLLQDAAKLLTDIATGDGTVTPEHLDRINIVVTEVQRSAPSDVPDVQASPNWTAPRGRLPLAA